MVVEYHGGPRARTVFFLVIISTLLLAAAWPFAFYFQFILDHRSSLFCGLVGGVFLWAFFVVVMQLHFAPKVNPLLYMPLIVDILIYEATIVFGSLASTFYGTLIVSVAVNIAMLALVWEELTNLAYSGVSRMWTAILPMSCFLTLASAGVFNLIIIIGLNLLTRLDIIV